MKKLLKFSLLFLFVLLFTVGASLLATAEEDIYTPAAPLFLPESVTVSPDASLSGYAYIVYDTEADFLEDIDDGVFDGKVGEFEAIVSSCPSGSFTMPTGGYVYMLEDCTHTTNAVFSGVQLQLNLGGHTLTLNGGGNYNTVNGNAKLAIFNGSLVDSIHGSGHGSFRCNGPHSIAFRDLVINSNVAWGNTETFANESSGSYYFENIVASYVGGGKTLVSMNAATTSSFVFKNVQFTSNTTALIRNHTPGVGNSTLYFDKTTSITGNTFLWTTAISSTSYVVSAEVGASFTDISFVGTNAVGFLAAAEEETKLVFGDGKYVLTAANAFIYWYDTDGNLVSEEPSLVFGSEVTPPDIGMIIEPDGDGYKYTTFAWSKTPGGAPSDFSGLVGENNFYAVPGTAKTATVVRLDADGAPIYAWDVANFTKEFINSLSDGAYIKLLRDFTVENTVDAYPGSLTVDLGGNTLTHNGAKWYAPERNKTVTIKNGALVNTATAELVVTSAGSGSIVFHDCTVTAPGRIAYMEGGRVVMELCTVEQSGNVNPFRIGKAGSNSLNDVTLELLGTRYTNSSPSQAVFIMFMGRPGDVNIKIGEYNGVMSNLRTGYGIQFRNEGIKADSSRTRINIEFNGVYFFNFNGLFNGDLTWDGAANPELTKNNARVYFNNFFGSRTDYLDPEKAPFLTAATRNVEAGDFKAVDRLNAETGVFEKKWVGSGVMNPNLAMLANLTLYADIDLNLFIPFSTPITEIKVAGEKIFDITSTEALRIYTDRASGEKYYVVTLADLAPNTAAQRFTLEITYAYAKGMPMPEGMSYFDVIGYASRNYSVVDYIDSFLDGEYSAAASETVKSLVAYITTCYDLFTATAVSDADTLASLRAIADSLGVTEYLEAVEPLEQEGDTDFDNSLGVMARFEIGEVTKLKISFPAGAEYKIKIGKRIVAEGAEAEAVIELRAYDLASVITISVGENSATFSLGEYAQILTANSNTDYYLAVKALYAYGTAARVLKTEIDSAGLL